MTVHSIRETGHTHLCLAGRLQAETAGVLKAAVRKELAANRTALLLDFSGVEFVNSTGLGALVSVLKEVRLARGHLVLCSLTRYIREIFEITQLVNIFDLHATNDGARQALRQKVSVQPAWSESSREVSP
jgi:anti-anti-sigma factor